MSSSPAVLPLDGRPAVSPPLERTALATRVAIGLLGFGVLGASAALVDGVSVVTLGTGPLVAALGTALLTTPTLVVGNELARLPTPPAAIVGTIADTLARAGQLAAWLAPIVLFFAIATPAWQVVYLLILFGLGAVTLGVAATRIAALGSRSVAIAWLVLATAVALHLMSGTFKVL